MPEEDLIRALRKGDVASARDTLELLKDELPRPRYLYLEGLVLEREGFPQDALRRYDMGLAMHLSDRSLWFAKARVLSHLGRMDLAKRAVERGMRLSHDDPWAHVFYGDMLMRMKEYDNAYSEAEKALSIDENDPGALVLMGLVLSMRDQDFESALICFERAIQVNPGDHQALTNRGIVLKKLGRMEDANRSLRKALTINPEDAAAKRTLEALECGAGDHDRVDKGLSDIETSNEGGRTEEDILEWEEDGLGETLELTCPRCDEDFEVTVRGRTRFRCPGCGLQGDVD
ncbi:MAG: tetratricopeptide repeat protein [Candidatus Thermoplasmatota archaeon]|nr:tetratricopeptide repeat protein [Candidatus Thermoplasmatota archaeon]